MKARHALGGLALMLGTALPAAAEPPDGVQLAQAQPGPGARPQSAHGSEGRGPMQGHHGWHRRAQAHHFSLARLALRHRQELALTSAQVDSLRKLGTDAQRDAIKRQADRRLAELDLRTLMMPDAADPAKAMDMAKVEAKVREIEKLRADERVARIRSLEQSRQVLTPEQREKLRALLAQRRQPRGPHGPGMRGMAPEDHGQAGAEDGSHSG
jgi:Spy/CpxP family protein refolding chaperone